MNSRTITCAALARGIAALLAVRAVSPDNGQPAKAPTAMEMHAMMDGMKAWLDSIKPGKHHEQLAHFVGTWNTTTRMWWGGTDAPRMKPKGRPRSNGCWENATTPAVKG